MFAVVGVFPVNGKCWQKKTAAVPQPESSCSFSPLTENLNEIFKYFRLFYDVETWREGEEEGNLVVACLDAFMEKTITNKDHSAMFADICEWAMHGSNFSSANWCISIFGSRNVLNLKVFPIFQSSFARSPKFTLPRCYQARHQAPVNVVWQHKNDRKLISS